MSFEIWVNLNGTFLVWVEIIVNWYKKWYHNDIKKEGGRMTQDEKMTSFLFRLSKDLKQKLEKRQIIDEKNTYSYYSSSFAKSSFI